MALFLALQLPARTPAWVAWWTTRRSVAALAASKKRSDRESVGLAKAVHRPGRSPQVAYPLHDMASPVALSGLPDLNLPFIVLGIETSCDDTAVGIVRSDGQVLADVKSSQHRVHAGYGGVVPGLAKKAHEEAIDGVVREALQEARLGPGEVDAVAATVGPGLEVCLRVGAAKGVQLARDWSRPFVGCHHLEAHCLVARLANDCPFPFAALVVSGGHTMILACEDVGRFDVIGGTLDDALGEAYDKAARMLDLDLSRGGGPALERVARAGDPSAVELPVPMRRRKDCDFSYAGLKNALRVQIQAARDRSNLPPDAKLAEDDVADLAASFQHVAVTHLEDRLHRALDMLHRDPAFADLSEPPVLALVGGVASNLVVRHRLGLLAERRGWRLAVPPSRLCTDNGVMIAWSAVERLRLGFSDELEDDVRVFPKFPFRAHQVRSAA